MAAGVSGTAGHVDVYATQAAGSGIAQTGDPVPRHEPMHAATVAFLQCRFAFATQRWAFARGAVGHAADPVAMQAEITSPHALWHGRHAFGIPARDAEAARWTISRVRSGSRIARGYRRRAAQRKQRAEESSAGVHPGTVVIS